jgi:hypothetical protein
MGLFHVANFQGTTLQSLGNDSCYEDRFYSDYCNYTASVYLGTFISIIVIFFILLELFIYKALFRARNII